MLLIPLDTPVDPDPDQARDWLYEELASPEYAAAQPTWFDLLVQQILDWFGQFSLDPGAAGGFPWWAVILGAIVVVIAVAVFRAVGLPRLLRRRATPGALFGDDDTRDAATMRRAARRAAAAGDYTTAIAELYRAIAREADERTLVSVLPGTTAHGFARLAGAVFPAETAALETSAADFDGVRYLGTPGTRGQWETMSALDDRLRSAKPLLADLPA